MAAVAVAGVYVILRGTGRAPRARPARSEDRRPANNRFDRVVRYERNAASRKYLVRRYHVANRGQVESWKWST